MAFASIISFSPSRSVKISHRKRQTKSEWSLQKSLEIARSLWQLILTKTTSTTTLFGWHSFATLSAAEQCKQYISENNVPNDSLSQVLRTKFGRDIRVERVIAAQGENAIIDYVAFGGTKPVAEQNKWNYYFGIGRIIATPEEALDVRGQVTADYQALLEKNWVEQLKYRYPVKINQKVLKKVK